MNGPFPLDAIKAQMSTVASMNLTHSARVGIRLLGISDEQAREIVQCLTGKQCVQVFESTKRPGTWQNVYGAWLLNTPLYVKFSYRDDVGEYVVVSFKESDRDW